jgi:hypothetical protein
MPGTIGIELSWPPEVDHDQARSVRLTIIANDLVVLPPTETRGSARISFATGDVFPDTGTARLVSNSFEVLEASPAQQSLTTTRTTWEWNVSSNKPGMQWVNVSVDFGYPEAELQVARQQPPNRWSYEFVIKVHSKPFIEFGTLSIAALVSPLLAGLISLPSVYSMIRERFAQQ